MKQTKQKIKSISPRTNELDSLATKNRDQQMKLKKNQAKYNLLGNEVNKLNKAPKVEKMTKPK